MALESYPPPVTGSGIATKRLAEGLSRRGHHVEVICPNRSTSYLKRSDSNIAVHMVPSIPIPFHQEFRCSFFPVFTVRHIFDEADPDIIHINDHLFICRAVYGLAHKKNIKVVGTNHFTPYNWIPNLGIQGKRAIRWAVEKILWTHFAVLFNKIDAVTTPSEIARSIIKDQGIRKPVQVISNGIDLGRFSKSSPSQDVLEKYNIDPQKTILLSASRLDREKRVDLLIDALHIIKDKADFQLIITGTGKVEKDLKKMAAVKGLKDRTVFTGLVPEGTLDAIYRAADIFVTASEVELQGLSIMEAMASGLPVVAASSMAIPELVKNGLNGYLFEPGNAREAGRSILELINDKRLRQDMSQNSLNMIRDHDFENILDRFEDLYYSSLGN